MTYKGPNVEVRQNFEITPPAVNVEALPSAVIGAAFDVYSKEKLGDSIGIADVDYAWSVDGDNKVIYSESQGTKLFNFYKPLVYAKDSDGLGDFLVTPGTLTASAAPISSDASYKIKDITADNGSYMPYFSATTAVTVPANSKVVSVAAGSGKFIDAKLPKGILIVTNDVVLGTLNRVLTQDTLELTAVYNVSTPYTGTAIYAGAASVATATKPAFIYDPNANYNTEGIKIGDFVAVTSNSLSGAITNASIVSVGDNLLQIFTGTATNVNKELLTQLAYSLTDYYASTSTAGLTANISSYSVSRFVGFSPKYNTSSPSVTVDGAPVGATLVLSSSFALNTGDKIMIEDDPGATIYTVVSGSGTTYVLDQNITGVDTKKVYAWYPSSSEGITNPIIASYRAVKVDALGTVFKNSDVDLIGTNGLFGEANVYNELAMMISITSGLNAGRIMYVVAIDPTLSEVTEYGNALEALKFFDVYSHAIGSDSAAINALLPAYVDEQSAPYEAHERIAVLGYNEDSVYTLGSDTLVSVTGGLITISGTINLQSIGLSIGDKVSFIDSDSSEQKVTVTAIPASSSTVQTDYDGTTTTLTNTATFLLGVKSKQTNAIKALGAISNRRVTIVWPGNFKADTVATGTLAAETAVTLPSYYITAAVAGLDGGKKVSQSLTNAGFSIPGLSNIQLGTNSYFRKLELDNAASGGIDIMIQKGNISSVISSRHDLTTNMDAIIYRERSPQKQSDTVAKTFRNSISPYLGKYNITPELLDFFSTLTKGIKKSILKDGVVAAVTVTSIKRDPDVIDKVVIAVRITVLIANNYVDIDLNIVA